MSAQVSNMHASCASRALSGSSASVLLMQANLQCRAKSVAESASHLHQIKQHTPVTQCSVTAPSYCPAPQQQHCHKLTPKTQKYSVQMQCTEPRDTPVTQCSVTAPPQFPHTTAAAAVSQTHPKNPTIMFKSHCTEPRDTPETQCSGTAPSHPPAPQQQLLSMSSTTKHHAPLQKPVPVAC
jgi:hypothetical protein